MNLTIIELKRVVYLFIDSSSPESSTPQRRYTFVTALGLSPIDLCNMSRTSNGSWRQGIKGEMTCTVYVALVWNIIYWIMMIITLFTE